MRQMIIVLCILVFSPPFLCPSPPTAEEVLRFFVTDYQKDPRSRDQSLTFGIKVRNCGEWHVTIDGHHPVRLDPGPPDTPAFFYQTDHPTLLRIHRGKISALTAMGRASMNDPAPLDFGFMDGYRPPPDFPGWFAAFTFHFWTRGLPEIVDFGPSTLSRLVHGAEAKILYYRKGLRTSWYRLSRGQHINRDPEDQTNPFPTLIIMIRGTMNARIGGESLTLCRNQCVHIPSGVSHEFTNPREEPAEFIIVMFGEGA